MAISMQPIIDDDDCSGYDSGDVHMRSYCNIYRLHFMQILITQATLSSVIFLLLNTLPLINFRHLTIMQYMERSNFAFTVEYNTVTNILLDGDR